MSPDRLTMTRAEAIRRRREEEQKRRDSQTQRRITTPKPKPAPAQPRVDRTPAWKPAPVKSAVTSKSGRRYDSAMNQAINQPGMEGMTFHVPAMKMPKFGFGARWLSFLLIAACSTALYYLTLPDSPFIVSGASINGNNRVSAAQISSVLGVMGRLSPYLNPSQIEYNILATFPDIATAQVDVNLPAEVLVTVSERQPVAAWQQDGQIVWVDAQGYAFPPRGLVEGLVTVSATGAPPTPENLNAAQTIGAKPFLSAQMAAALATLSPYVPQGSALIYDPKYGLGWSDPRGWQAYFGNSSSDVAMKLQVYQSMVDYLIKKNISPKLISVEYPNAPFYRVEQP